MRTKFLFTTSKSICFSVAISMITGLTAHAAQKETINETITDLGARTVVLGKETVNGANQAALNAREKIDQFLVNEFPNDALSAQYLIQGAETAVGLILMYKSVTFERLQNNALKKEAATVERLIRTRLPKLEGEIDIAQRTYDVADAKRKLIAEFAQNQELAVSGIKGKLTEEIAEIDAKMIQAQKILEAFDTTSKTIGSQLDTQSGAAVDSAKSAVNSVKQSIEESLRDYSAQKVTLEANLLEYKGLTNTLPASLIGESSSKTIQVFDDAINSENQLKALREEHAQITERSAKITAQLNRVSGGAYKFSAKGLRLIGIAGSTVMLADGGIGIYIVHTLGKDPSISTLNHFLHTTDSEGFKKAYQSALQGMVR